jgi:hypothetical protein
VLIPWGVALCRIRVAGVLPAACTFAGGKISLPVLRAHFSGTTDDKTLSLVLAFTTTLPNFFLPSR